MEKIHRPKIEEIEILSNFKETLKTYCEECAAGNRTWQSSGKLYNLLKEALSLLTNHHCSFCDGFPLNNTSKETIEHYQPKADYKDKTYDWDNLFLCCDKCQSQANKMAFEFTVKPDLPEYAFDKYFYFEPQDGKVKSIEENTDSPANKFLKRYGINNNAQRLEARKKLYKDLYFKFKNNAPDLDRNDEPNRFVYDVGLSVYNFQKKLVQ
jgi:uncharacterized protein (TIGR02646 family)